MKRNIQIYFLVLAWIVPSINALVLLAMIRKAGDPEFNCLLEAYGLSFSYTLILFFILMFVAVDIIKRNPLFKTFLLGLASCVLIPLVMGFLSDLIIANDAPALASSAAAGALAGIVFAVPYLAIAIYRIKRSNV